jgi:hypothetical protein
LRKSSCRRVGGKGGWKGRQEREGGNRRHEKLGGKILAGKGIGGKSGGIITSQQGM